ncbi:sulfotransferase [Marivirga sp. S37H4]|uniref:Sulfotransferase n=1 Tax=Marivirga aurantiaca TaxID=2802615 RepID=A0A934X096_9BACT|nr:sulfotransferase [Marivirga aurantiaca]MBK6266523.1 sulfotransferase [Marivirga aurantiaca]
MQKKHSLLPDFLIIGAGKSGTTSVDNYLKQHPSIFISSRKEPNFFGYELNTAEDFKGMPQLNHYNNSITDLNQYLQLFEPARENQLKGETSNTYMYHEAAPDRILHHIPKVKLIAILRQPAERLYSRFLHLARENRLPTENFSDCLDKNTVWWTRNDLIKEGFYGKYLSKYYKRFDKSQIKVFIFEELKNGPEKMMAEIFDFLGVDSSFELDFSVEYNQSGFIKNKKFDSVFGSNGLINKTAKTLLPNKLIHLLRKNVTVQKNLQTIRSKNLHKPKLEKELKKQITNNIYLDDIKLLEKVTGKDLSHWYKD